MKNKINNILNTLAKKSLILVVTLLLGVHSSLAALPLLFYVNSFDAEVGDTISFDLKLNPSIPVYTVGTTLSYDPSLLTFVSASASKDMFAVAKVPYELTDTTNGKIKRTGSFNTAITSPTDFI